MSKSKFSKHLEKAGLTNREVVELIQPHFPKFTKIQCSMLAHPDQYGVQLTPEAKKYLPALPSKPKKPKSAKMASCGNCALRWTTKCALYIGYVGNDKNGKRHWGSACSDDDFACSKGEINNNDT